MAVKNVLFIFSRHSRDSRDSTLTKDLSDEFARQGMNVYVMTMLESRYELQTTFTNENGCNVLRVRTGNYFNCKSRVEKVCTILTLPFLFKQAAKTYLKDVAIDLIITHTPFVSSPRIVNPLKRFFKCKAHLILWDIFPQNAWDIGIIENKFIFKLFKFLEIKMLKAYDQIWCMSNGNVQYLRQNYPALQSVNVNLLYNSSKIKSFPVFNKRDLRQQLGYSEQDVIAVFGGNMGVPQRLENILMLVSLASQRLEYAKFIFIGVGTETEHLKKLAEQMNLTNIRFIEQLVRDEYELITAVADIGLVSLDQRFTVPNFPSKTTDYFKLKLPILASLDDCAISDYGYFLTNIAQAGIHARAGHHEELYNMYLMLYSDANLRTRLGVNGRNFYEQELDVKLAFNKILAAQITYR